MEIENDINVEHSSSELTNENSSNNDVDVEDDNEEDDYIDVENLCDIDEADVHWEIEEDSDENDIDFSQYIKLNSNVKPKALETKRQILTATRKLKKSNSDIIKSLSKKKKLDENELNLPTAKKTKYIKECDNKMHIDTQFNTINFKNISEVNKIPINTTLLESTKKSGLSNNDDQNYNETNVMSFNSSDFSNSYSSTSMPGPSGCNRLPSSYKQITNDYNSTIQVDDESLLLYDFYNKTFLDEYDIPMTKSEENTEINQHVEAIPIQECDLIKHLSKKLVFENNCKESHTDNSECFVEDPDIVNPDIMYNISLNEHYKQMDILVQNISKTSDDLTVLHECMQLTPIPQIEHEKVVFTTEERLNFLNGVSEWEYEIDSEDWNKIMVKRSVVFTAHAGFSIANEESLYVLADVAIDYIKKLAVVMKKNFDIQSKSSLPDKIDPIDNSLQEIGVKGGIRDLIKHYEDDVFVRRNKLMKKCQHLQKIIDQYIERMFLDTTIKNQYNVKDDIKEKNTKNDKCIPKEDNAQLKENELISEETNTEIQINIDEEKMDTQSTIEEKVISDINKEQKELIYIDNRNTEIKTDTDPKNIDNTKISAININETKINQTKIKEKKLLDYNLLKPMVPEPFDCEPESIICKFKERCSTKSYVENQIRNISYIDKLENSDEKEKESTEKRILFDIATVKKMMECLNAPNIEKPVKGSMKLHKMLKEFDDGFNCYKATYNKNDISPINTVITQSDKIPVNDNHKLFQSVPKLNYDKGESSSSKDTI